MKNWVLMKTKSRSLATVISDYQSRNINDEKANVRYCQWHRLCLLVFLIYFILLIYGSQVMMGVMEEKTNRIAEVIVSSVKPFQLMLGKIIGIGLVALTQFLLWIAFIFIIYNVTQSYQAAASGAANDMVGSIQKIFTSINVPLDLVLFWILFPWLVFSFILLYMALLAVPSMKICGKRNH